MAAAHLRDQQNTMTTLNATLISDDEYRRAAPSKANRPSSSGPAQTGKSSNTNANRHKESIPTRSSTGGYYIPTQNKDSNKRSSSQRVTASATATATATVS